MPFYVWQFVWNFRYSILYDCHSILMKKTLLLPRIKSKETKFKRKVNIYSRHVIRNWSSHKFVSLSLSGEELQWKEDAPTNASLQQKSNFM